MQPIAEKMPFLVLAFEKHNTEELKSQKYCCHRQLYIGRQADRETDGQTDGQIEK